MKVARRFWLLALPGIALVAAFATHSREGISVSWSPGLDALCSHLRGPAIQEEWKTELSSRLEEYRGLWNSVGPRLLGEAEALTGLERPASAHVRLTLCNLPSQSIFGTSVNMRFALQSFTATPVPLRYKVDTQFHELLHDMLGGHIPGDSPLLAGHADVSQCVKNHLHLLALQKAVLLALDERVALADVVRFDSSLPSDCYRIAWQIVNASESAYLSYVDEIKD